MKLITIATVTLFAVACGSAATEATTDDPGVVAPVAPDDGVVTDPPEPTPVPKPDGAAPKPDAAPTPEPDAAHESDASVPDAASDAAPDVTPDAAPDAAPPDCPGYVRVLVAIHTCVKAVNCTGFILIGGDASIGAGSAAFQPGAPYPAICDGNDLDNCIRLVHPSSATPKAFDVFIKPNAPASCTVTTYPFVGGVCPVNSC